MNEFNKKYFESGLENGISLYSNYHWIPERSFKEAHWFVNYMNVGLNHTVLDFGCAKGFFVKAMRLLGYKCYGVDISDYALKHAEKEVKDYLFKETKSFYNFGFCKDVLEHSKNEKELIKNINKLYDYAHNWLVIVPLAENGKYNIPLYEKDITHYIRYNENQWMDIFKKVGFSILENNYQLFGFKDHWNYSKSNLFLKLYC